MQEDMRDGSRKAKGLKGGEQGVKRRGKSERSKLTHKLRKLDCVLARE